MFALMRDSYGYICYESGIMEFKDEYIEMP